MQFADHYHLMLSYNHELDQLTHPDKNTQIKLDTPSLYNRTLNLTLSYIFRNTLFQSQTIAGGESITLFHFSGESHSVFSGASALRIIPNYIRKTYQTSEERTKSVKIILSIKNKRGLIAFELSLN